MISWEVEERKAESDREYFSDVEPDSPIAVASMDESENVIAIAGVGNGNNANVATMADVSGDMNATDDEDVNLVVSIGIDVDGNVHVIVNVDDVNVIATLGAKPIWVWFDLVLLWQS